jgi:hypothetical protein
MTPSEIVQKQLDAYDTGDIDAFLATYAPEIAVYDFPSTLIMEGHAQMREVYTRVFAAAPDLKTHISPRIAIGDFVIDNETVTGTADGIPKRVVAIYEVKEELITKVWFVK